MKKLHLFLFDLLEHHESRLGKFFGVFIVFLVVFSSIVFVLESTPLDARWGGLFDIIEAVVIGIFTLEYILRLLIVRQKFRFVFSFLGIIDLLVILPFYFGFFHLTFLRGFRVLKILRLLKVIRYSEVMVMFFRSFRYYREELLIFGITFSLVLLLSSLGLHTLEYAVNPAFATIGDSLWWAIVTMTTIGYGDAVPITMLGKTIAGIVMILGLATIALMTAILTKIFIDHFFGKRLHRCEFCHYPHHDHDAKFCKNCGKQLDIGKLLQAEIAKPHSHSASSKTKE